MAIDSSKDEAWNKQIEYMAKVFEKEEKKQQELGQYKNNWEELKKYLEQATEILKTIEHDDYICYENVLNKMKELEEE